MWAIVEIGKKQYKVKEGDIVQVQRVSEESLVLDKVLALAKDDQVRFGQPYLAGVRVKAEKIEEKKGDKVIVYKVKRRKKYRKTRGHRQIYSYLKISQISSKK